ncbi:DUF6286 domain-containing protein [Streptosporangium soli]|nr:DUF6286 domain-containing protein [Streptosporangium sp. KLBMP 9127]
MTSVQDAAPAPARAPVDTKVLRRPRTPAGLAVAVPLSAVLSLLAAEAVSEVMGAPLGIVPFERLAAVAATRAWSDPLVQCAAGGLAVLGFVLLAAALIPGRSRLVPVKTADPLIVIGFTRAGLCRTLRTLAESVDGVDHARVRLVRGQIEISVVTEAECAGTLLRQVGATVGDRLAGLGALGGAEVVVRLRGTGA